MKIFKALLPWLGFFDFILMIAVGAESARLIVFEGVRTWYVFGVLYFMFVLVLARFIPILTVVRKRIRMRRDARRLAARISGVGMDEESEKKE